MIDRKIGIGNAQNQSGVGLPPASQRIEMADRYLDEFKSGRIEAIEKEEEEIKCCDNPDFNNKNTCVNCGFVRERLIFENYEDERIYDCHKVQ